MLKELPQGEKKGPQLETRQLQMGKLTNKGKHTVKVENHHHTNMIIKTSNQEERRVPMQDNGNAFEIKRPAT